MRQVLLVIHPSRPEAHAFAVELISALREKNIASITNFPGGIPGSSELDDSSTFETFYTDAEKQKMAFNLPTKHNIKLLLSLYIFYALPIDIQGKKNT
jgi:hypothetical protein